MLILDNLQDFGVKNCSWVHSLESLTSNIKDETESLVTNFFTRLFGLVVAFVFLFCSFMASSILGLRQRS